MRGTVPRSGRAASIAPEARVPANHPLRKIRALVRDVLGKLNRSLGKLYASEGRPLNSAGAAAERAVASGVLRRPVGTPVDGARLSPFSPPVGFTATWLLWLGLKNLCWARNSPPNDEFRLRLFCCAFDFLKEAPSAAQCQRRLCSRTCAVRIRQTADFARTEMSKEVSPAL